MLADSIKGTAGLTKLAPGPKYDGHSGAAAAMLMEAVVTFLFVAVILH